MVDLVVFFGFWLLGGEEFGEFAQRCLEKEQGNWKNEANLTRSSNSEWLLEGPQLGVQKMGAF